MNLRDAALALLMILGALVVLAVICAPIGVATWALWQLVGVKLLGMPAVDIRDVLLATYLVGGIVAWSKTR